MPAFPPKTNYAAGDVLTAAQMNDVGNALSAYQTTTGKNKVINGNFQVWQRGTSIALTTTAYTADRWQGYRAVAGSTVSRQVTNDTTNLPNIQYCARVQRDSGNTSTSLIYLGYSMESADTVQFIGKTITISFYARAGANYSATSGNLMLRVRTGTGTDQNVVTAGYTGSANLIQQNSVLTTTWQRFTYSATVGTTATELGFFFEMTPTGTAGANDWFEVTGVQLEAGSTATPFTTASGTIQGELALCQRYYTIFNGASGTAMTIGGNATAASQTYYFPISLPVTMRVAPTLTKNGTWGTVNSGQPALGFAQPNNFTIYATPTASGAWYCQADSTDDTITASAEL